MKTHLLHGVFGASMLFLLAGCGGGGSSSSPTVTVPPPPPPATNNAPVISSANNDQSAQASQSFSYDATQSGNTFSDVDGDTLTYSISFSPNALGLTDANGVVSGTPSQAGTITVTITADDGNGGTVSDRFDIVVSNPPPSSSGKPNIVFIISDDQGQDSSAQYSLSSDLPVTPNFTALANSGLIFDNAWVSPSCSPTRAALMTAKHSNKTSVFSPGDALPPSEIILQSYLKDESATADYTSAVIGKWHLGGGQGGPNNFGIDHFAGIIGGGVQDYNNWSLNVNGTSTTSTNYVTSELTDQAISWVDAQTQPWFLWLSYNAPHTPFHLPPSGLHTQSLSGTQTDIDNNPRPYYLAAIEAMDTEFGRFWNSLSAQEQADTIVIYLGDNGTPRQVVDRAALPTGNKSTLYQAGIQVPMFMAGPGITRAGEREGALVNHTDIFTTIAELAGAELPAYNDGQSFADLLSSSSDGPRDYAYSENDEGWAIRNPQYKLIQDNSGAQELYDLIADPTEKSNLVGGAADISAILSELETAADEIRDSTNISGVKFSNSSPFCSDYTGSYRASASDIGRGQTFQATLNITANNNRCTLSSNSIPNHNFNDGVNGFPNATGPVNESFTVPRSPILAASPTPLTLTVDNAILLNGVKVDVLAAACFGVGDERSGCGNIDQPWRFDPMHGPNGFNVDSNNAHTQPDGAYHYHGPPPIFNGNSQTVSGVIGYAADGFPIFGPYFDDGTNIRKAVPSYALKSGSRPTGTNDPGGAYDGTFRDDYEFLSGSGDLDACNGMTVNGQYGYYVTDGFPYIIGCFSGTPDSSFNK